MSWVGVVLLILIGAFFMGGCVTSDPEKKTYPLTWPALEASANNKCAMPEGLFANAPALSRFQYPEDQHKSMFLSHIFDVGSTPNMPTHMKFDHKPNGDLSVTVFEKIDEQYMQIAALTIQRKDTKCRRGRFSILSSTTHETFKSYQDDDYDPLYTAAYVIGTFGLGAPISKWYEYNFALNSDNALTVRRLQINSGLLFLIYTRTSMADDWFIFEPAPPDVSGKYIFN